MDDFTRRQQNDRLAFINEAAAWRDLTSPRGFLLVCHQRLVRDQTASIWALRSTTE